MNKEREELSAHGMDLMIPSAQGQEEESPAGGARPDFQNADRPDAPAAAGFISLERFGEITEEITGTLPEEFFRELHGGVIIREQVKIHPAARDNDLFVMGEYHRDRYLGRFVVLYYGSFAACWRYLPEAELREKIRKVIYHEFLHHLESLAGERDLEIEDAKQLARYKNT